MKQEHLVQIRVVYDALNRRDVDALRSLTDIDPEFSWESAADEPDTGVRHGTASAIAFSGELLETFGRIQIDVDRVIDLGPDAAIFVLSMRMRGAASGIDVERSEVHLWTTRDGRIASLREFSNVEDAMAAAP